LRKYTKKRDAISDAPKNYDEQLRAKPGYGLPLLSSFRQEVDYLLPSGKIKKLPVASIAINNMSDSYRERNEEIQKKSVSRIAMSPQITQSLRSPQLRSIIKSPKPSIGK
jgi:hypothetical protein